MKSDVDSYLKAERKEKLMKERYEKKLNNLVHGLKESEGPWGTEKNSKEIFNSFVF